MNWLPFTYILDNLITNSIHAWLTKDYRAVYTRFRILNRRLFCGTVLNKVSMNKINNILGCIDLAFSRTDLKKIIKQHS